MSGPITVNRCEHGVIQNHYVFCTECYPRVDAPVFVDDDNVRHPIINTVVSDPSDTLDQLVQRASTPNLASLFKQGQAAGLIKPTEGYV